MLANFFRISTLTHLNFFQVGGFENYVTFFWERWEQMVESSREFLNCFSLLGAIIQVEHDFAKFTNKFLRPRPRLRNAFFATPLFEHSHAYQNQWKLERQLDIKTEYFIYLHTEKSIIFQHFLIPPWSCFRRLAEGGKNVEAGGGAKTKNENWKNYQQIFFNLPIT